MNESKAVFCTICGEPHRAGETWFLLTENRWTDRLKILGWNDQFIDFPGVYPACGASHVQQLVVHWMAMGSLAHPFARAGAVPRPVRRRNAGADAPELAIRGAKIIGELPVHRESLSRILVESPESLASILEALISALSGDRRPVPAEESEEQERMYEMSEV
jgi:hypothetical protein